MSIALPGIAFEAAARAVDETLPRMDVAAIVGLASRGPVGMPVACEDLGRFREVFGPDLVLGRDDVSGRVASSHLGPAVEAFFAAGGRRCLVVRVARTAQVDDAPAAGRARFRLPGVVASLPGTSPSGLASVIARSVGGWADGHGVAVGVDREPLSGRIDLSELTIPGDGWWAGGWALSVGDLAVGDLLELRIGDLTAFAPVTDVLGPELLAGQALPDGVVRRPGLPVAIAGTGRRRWFRRPLPQAADGVELLGADGPRPLDVALDGHPEGGYRVTGSDADDLRSGDLLRVQAGDDRILAPVGRDPGGILAGPLWQAVAEQRALEEVGALDPADAAGTLRRVHLRLRLLAGDGEVARLDGAGFEAEHPRGLPGLPVDEVRFQDPDAAASPFPLVGAPPRPPAPFPAPGAASPPRGPALTPLVVTPPGTWTAPAAVEPDDGAVGLAREGLLPLTAELFVDPGLATSSIASLRRLADQYRVDGARDVTGVHVVLARRQVTLACAPDAVHVGWRRLGVDAPTLPSAPEFAVPVRDGDRLVVSWTPVADALGYELEILAEPGGERVTAVHRLPAGTTTTTVPDPTSCDDETALRVRALLAGPERGPASATRLAGVAAGDFEACDAPAVALDLEVEGPAPGGAVRLAWTDPQGDAVDGVPPDRVPPDRVPPDRVPADRVYELETGQSADLADGRTRRVAVRDGVSTLDDVTVAVVGNALVVSAVVSPREGRVLYARTRVAATGGMLAGGVPAGGMPAGPWSRVVGVPPTATDRLAVDERAAADGLRDVQRALLLSAAARGDVLAVLSLPRRARGADVARALDRLNPRRAAADADEVVARRYGAAYHPWVVGGDGTTHPPDGSVCGMLADTALQRGAWSAPAGRPIAGAVGVSPASLDAVVVARAGANPLRLTVPGVVAVTGRTLATDVGLDRIGPRRLLMLLRRLAEREGARQVFEPHGPDLAAGLQATFTRVLTDLFARGALAGDAPSDAFEVVVGGERSDPARERGAIVVELRVAPARPLEFLTVRLLAVGGRLGLEAAA